MAHCLVKVLVLLISACVPAALITGPPRGDVDAAAAARQKAEEAAPAVYDALPEREKDELVLKRPRADKTDVAQWWIWKQAMQDTSRVDRMEKVAMESARASFEALPEIEKDELVLERLREDRTDRRHWWVYTQALRDTERAERMESVARADAKAAYDSLPQKAKEQLAASRLDEASTNRRQYWMYQQALKDETLPRNGMEEKDVALAEYEKLSEADKNELVLKRLGRKGTDLETWKLFQEALKDSPRVEKMEAAAKLLARAGYHALSGEDRDKLVAKTLQESRTNRRLWWIYQEALQDKPRVAAIRAASQKQGPETSRGEKTEAADAKHEQPQTGLRPASSPEPSS
mmetsp:Transcript_105919/g.297826  ORF Transcript_105919/g.297826 Transcript_105919/m.297826 type:complete len:347 (-) Transcript_105919:133-1173(-)